MIPPAPAWEHLAISGVFLVIVTEEGATTDIWWVETKKAAETLQCTGRPLQQGMIQLKMLGWPGLRNPGLDYHKNSLYFLAIPNR